MTWYKLMLGCVFHIKMLHLDLREWTRIKDCLYVEAGVPRKGAKVVNWTRVSRSRELKISFFYKNMLCLKW